MTKLSANYDYSGYDFSDKNLRELDLRASCFVGAKLKGADVFGANFQGCDFRGSDVNAKYLQSQQCDIRWAIFGEAEVKQPIEPSEEVAALLEKEIAELSYNEMLIIAGQLDLYSGKNPKKDELRQLVESYANR